MKKLIFGAVFALFTLTTFASNETPNENLLPIAETTFTNNEIPNENLISVEDNTLPMPDCFYIGNMIFDVLGESQFTVWLANQVCDNL